MMFADFLNFFIQILVILMSLVFDFIGKLIFYISQKEKWRLRFAGTHFAHNHLVENHLIKYFN